MSATMLRVMWAWSANPAPAAMLASGKFVCIPRPIERSPTPDGGPLAFRVIHRVKRWQAGERPELRGEVVEGAPPLAMK